MYKFNYEIVQSKYRILEKAKNKKFFTKDIKKLKKMLATYKNIYDFLERGKALLTQKQYDNIFLYYSSIKENIRNIINSRKYYYLIFTNLTYYLILAKDETVIEVFDKKYGLKENEKIEKIVRTCDENFKYYD